MIKDFLKHRIKNVQDTKKIHRQIQQLDRRSWNGAKAKSNVNSFFQFDISYDISITVKDNRRSCYMLDALAAGGHHPGVLPRSLRKSSSCSTIYIGLFSKIFVS